MHEPLPYIVRFVEVAKDGEDTVPIVHERRVMAYDVLEAYMQALLEAGGKSGLDDSKYRCESIAPDVTAYPKMHPLSHRTWPRKGKDQK